MSRLLILAQQMNIDQWRVPPRQIPPNPPFLKGGEGDFQATEMTDRVRHLCKCL